jgi:hypothetical protein
VRQTFCVGPSFVRIECFIAVIDVPGDREKGVLGGFLNTEIVGLGYTLVFSTRARGHADVTIAWRGIGGSLDPTGSKERGGATQLSQETPAAGVTGRWGGRFVK